MRVKKLQICISGFLLLTGLMISGYSLLVPSNSAEAYEYLPTDFLEAGDNFRLIVDVDSNGFGAVTYSYEFAD